MRSKPYAIFLLQDRCKREIHCICNEPTKDMPGRMEECMKIISYGILSIKGRKLAEDVTIISIGVWNARVGFRPIHLK